MQNLIDSGVLLTDERLYEVVKSRLSQIPRGTGVIFDGIPRRVSQAEFLLDYLKQQGRTEFATLFVDLPKEESLARLLKRAEIEGRKDDRPEKIEFRLKQYQEDTRPVLDFLKKQTKFFEIDGEPEIEEVTKNIFLALNIN